MFVVGAAVGAAAVAYVGLTGPSVPPTTFKPPTADELPQYEPGTRGGVTDPRKARPIVYAKTGIASKRFPTQPQMLIDVVRKHGDEVALRIEQHGYPADRAGTWIDITWREYHQKVVRFAKSLLAVGATPFCGVAICGFNAPEWFISHLGAAFAGCLSAGTYTTNGPSACAFVADHSKSVVVVCDTMANAKKYVSVRSEIPTVKKIVVWGEAVPQDLAKDVMSFNDFLELGNAIPDDRINTIVEKQQPQDAVSLIYTSGTTGDPKGVMVSHDNYAFACASAHPTWGRWSDGEQISISYLPCSHIAAQVLDIALPMYLASVAGNTTVCFARPDALKGSLGVTLKAVRPTLFFGVPRVWEKFVEGIKAKAAAAPPLTGLKAKLVAWAKSVSLQYCANRQVGGSGACPPFYKVAQKVLHSKVKEALGFDRCTRMVTGAAPISKETLNFLAALGIEVMEVYGMSESSGIGTTGRPGLFHFGSCGAPYLATEMKLDHEPTRDKPGEGEICYRGRHVMLGYLNNAEKTRDAIDDDGWLHSGDVGRFDPSGLLYITGRIKELIIGAGGENIAPVPIENEIKRLHHGLSNVVIIGDKQKYNVCLVTLKTQPDLATGSFHDTLINEATTVNAAVKTVAQAANDTVWRESIEKAIKAYNSGPHCISNASKVQKFAILPTDLSIPGGELTATMKIKRSYVTEKYKDEIAALYAESE